MANDDDMRRLMEQLLPDFPTCRFHRPADVGPPKSFVPSGHITKELLTLTYVLLTTEQCLAIQKWNKMCVKNLLNALSSHEMYLRYVMFACDIDIALSDDVFDRVVKVCTVMMTFNLITLTKTGVNFCTLILDVFMVFYNRVLKKPFYRQGGFTGFKKHLQAEYHSVLHHFECNADVPVANRISYVANKLEKLEKMNGNVPYQLENIKHEDVTRNSRCHKLAKEVLATTKIELPSLPCSKDLKVRILANGQNIAARSEKSKTTPVDHSKRETTLDGNKRETPTPDSKPGTTGIVMQRSSNFEAIDSVEDKENKAWCDNIVRTVTMYNNSRRSDPADANHQIQKDAHKILDQLKDTLTSLIHVLDKYDEE